MNFLSLLVGIGRSARSAYMHAQHYAQGHKVVAGAVALVVLGGGWWLWSSGSAQAGPTRYVLGEAATTTIIATVSASGQVTANQSLDVKPQEQGRITWVGIKPGDVVRAGQALAAIDSTQALQAYKDAQRAYAAAQLQYQKDSAQAPISHQQNLDALQTAQQDLTDGYNNAYNDLTAAYLDVPAAMTAAQGALYGYDFDSHRAQWNMDVLLNLFAQQDTATQAPVTGFEVRAKSDFAAANTAYNAALANYQQLTRTSATSTLESVLAQSTAMVTALAQALQTELNFYASVSDLAATYDLRLPANFATVQSATRSSLATTNADLSTLLAQAKALTTVKQNITSAQQSLQLEAVGNDSGTNPISLQIEKNNLDKQAADLAQQGIDLGLYTVRAPFDGMVASVAAKVADTTSGAVATIVSSEQVAQLSLNEVDAAKIKVGNKATLTFDAIDGLTLTGTVAAIDPVGTVAQGVVSYTIQITLDTQDARVKPGMTINADIQTAVRQNTLAVPSSAIKTQNGQNYVLVFNPPIPQSVAQAAGAQGVLSDLAPQQVAVETGISDDTQTEILSGLSAGEQVVASTRQSSAAAATASRTTTANTRGGLGGGAVLRAF